jgi:hypothetical protein
MDAPPVSADAPSSRSSLPPDLEEKLRTCEAIAARMDVLQQQVDLELEHLQSSPSDGPTTSYYTSPAIIAAVTKVLHWIREKVAGG